MGFLCCIRCPALALGGLVLVIACTPSPGSERQPRSVEPAPQPDAGKVPQRSQALAETSVKISADPTTPPPLQATTTFDEPFSPELVLHQAEDVAIGGDRHLRVAHAEETNHKAIIYLHGMCGNPKGAEPWIDLATKIGTVITVRGNVPCPERPGYKWPKDVHEIQPRIDAALTRVREIRGGRLITTEVLLVGYSQGAHRAEKLASAYPVRYPDLILGGPPTAPDPELLPGVRSVAILGGELEDTIHMEDGYLALKEAGLRSRFFVLPRSHHGSYGPSGREVMSEVFGWLAAN